MAKPRKSSKSTGKKAVTKRGSSKKTSPRKVKVDKHKANQDRLLQDRAYYEAQEPINPLRRTKPTKKNPKGVTLASLLYRDKDVYNKEGYWYSASDKQVKLSDLEFKKLAANPMAVPAYTPLHRDGKIVAFRNTHNGDIVTPYYRYKVFGKYFNPKVTPEEFATGRRLNEKEQERGLTYKAMIKRQAHAKVSRGNDLARSYRLLHPTMNINQIKSDPTFQGLVGQLEAFHSNQYMNITAANQQMILNIYGKTAEELNDEGFAAVLVLLGRRLPNDPTPPGESDRDHIKNVVMPWLESMNNSVPIELEE